jgi:predicted ATP-grasp superfamily ATP-dependent carboligase
LNVLVTDAGFPHSLAAIRSLGRNGSRVIATCSSRLAMSFFSRYCSKAYTCADPINEPAAYISDIIAIAKKEKCDVLLPISYASCLTVSKYQEEVKKVVNVPIAELDSMLIASNKNKTVKFATKLGIPTPETFFPTSVEDVIEISKIITYPVVVKLPEGSARVKYINSSPELIESYKTIANLSYSNTHEPEFPQIQQYIKGNGYGFFALFNHGKVRAVFSHKRIHEYPPTGGPSTMAQSVFDPDLQFMGIKLLEALKWHGVAMVEVKKDIIDNHYKLIEINPKFWGSLDLAIQSGVDFPSLACKMCVEGDIDPVFEYNSDVTYRWILPDLKYSLACNTLKKFIADFSNKTTKSDFNSDDMKPFIFQLSVFIGWLFISAVKRQEIRYPHGLPAEV